MTPKSSLMSMSASSLPAMLLMTFLSLLARLLVFWDPGLFKELSDSSLLSWSDVSRVIVRSFWILNSCFYRLVKNVFWSILTSCWSLTRCDTSKHCSNFSAPFLKPRWFFKDSGLKKLRRHAKFWNTNALNDEPFRDLRIVTRSIRFNKSELERETVLSNKFEGFLTNFVTNSPIASSVWSYFFSMSLFLIVKTLL